MNFSEIVEAMERAEQQREKAADALARREQQHEEAREQVRAVLRSRGWTGFGILGGGELWEHPSEPARTFNLAQAIRREREQQEQAAA